MNNLSFNTVKALNLQSARSALYFPIEREKLMATDSGKIVSKSVIFHTVSNDDGSNERQVLGYIPEKRKIIPYTDMMDWIVSELSNLGTEYKLIESGITGRECRLDQRYVFDVDIDNPDGEALIPMMMVTGSYIGLPLAVEMGTYRLVCENGAMVKIKEFGKARITANDVESLRRQNIREVVARSLNSMDVISTRYKEMASEDWTGALIRTLSSPIPSVSFKKSIVEHLESHKDMYKVVSETIKNEGFLGLKAGATPDEIVDRDNRTIFKINNQKSEYDFYNDMTYVSTHFSASKALQRNNDFAISQLLAV